MDAPKKARGELASKTAQEKYGTRYNFLRSVQKPFFAIGWRIEQQCARIETKHELEKWNRDSK